MTEPTNPTPKLPPTVECARLFREAYGVGPVLGPSRDVNQATFYGVSGRLTPTTDLTGTFDPATRLGMACLIVSINGSDTFLDVLNPTLHTVLAMQKEAGWPLASQSLRYIDRLTDRPDPADVPAFPTITTKAHIDPGAPVDFHRIPAAVAVRWLAHKRDRMQLAKSPQSLVELALAALARAVTAYVNPGVDEGTARVVEQILESRKYNGQLTGELSHIIASMLREERAEDDARFAYLARDLELGFGGVDPHEAAANLAFEDDPDSYEPEERHYARAMRIGIDAEREQDRVNADKESIS